MSELNLNKLKMQTPDICEENIKKLKELFPQIVSEDKIDFDILKQLLSNTIVEADDERYRLDWVGKKRSLLKANTPINKTLRPCKEESVDFENTKNLYIEGDNFEVLKLLQESYLNKVKMIYIDPPYNTGKDFVYCDNFTQKKDEFEDEIGLRDEEGNKLFKNTDSNGRFHSDWLSMMYERLLVARDLLKDDGVIFISIDDNEVHNLRKICDEIFGEGNFISLLSIENNPKGRKNSKFISVSNEYCLIYSKDIEKSSFIENIPKNINDMKLDEDGNYVHNSGKRVLVGENNFNKIVQNYNSDKHYTVYYNPKKNEIKIEIEKNINDFNTELLNNGFERYISYCEDKFVENTYTHNKFKELFEKKSLEIREDKIFEKNFNSTIRMKSLITNRTYDALVNNDRVLDYKIDVKTTSAGTYLKELFNSNDVLFTAPKSVGLLNLFLTLFEEKDYIALDFFSGSATTAHAVMDLNAQDGGNRKFIMVQIPENTDEKSESYKAGYKNICEIGKERIRRAGKKIVEESGGTDLDIGFRVLKVDNSNMKDVYYHPNQLGQGDLPYLETNIKEDRSDLDLLFSIMLDLGITLDLKITTKIIDDKKLYIIENSELVVCFENSISLDVIEFIKKEKPLKVVLKDACFENDTKKINAINELSLITNISVI